MKDNEYIILSNRLRIAFAREILLPVMSGEEFFVDQKIYNNVMKELYDLELTTYKYELIKEANSDENQG